VFNAAWQLLEEHWAGPATAALGEGSFMEADMNCWALRREPQEGAASAYVGANFGVSHRDQAFSACHCKDTGAPTSVNLWTPFNASGAMADNGAMRVLPSCADDFFFSPEHPLHFETAASLAVEGAREAVRVLQCGAGAACLWSPALVHWGGGCAFGAAGEPRESLAVTFRGARAPRSQFGAASSISGGGGEPGSSGPEPMLRSALDSLSLPKRLAYVAKGLLSYSHWHPGFPGVALAKA
jgi:hypothetical protein